MVYKVGTKVEIIRIDIKLLEHSKRPIYGRITGIDGEYIMVRPSWCSWEIELYRYEIRVVL